MPDEGRRSDERRGFADAFWPALRAAQDGVDGAAVAGAAAALARACRAGGVVFTLGNGGSAATASHFASDLDAALTTPGGAPPGARVTCLSDNVPRLTAIANDHGYADVFARRLRAAARPGDVVVLFSVSGASENLHRAAAAARAAGAATIGVFGARDPGAAQAAVDHLIAVPSADFAVVESVHAALEHVLAGEVRARLATLP
jgi:D-sedoheptulose 7-phosphate isomerase